jgi:coenzyme F420-reducing hydrogenase delta subunit
MTTTQLTRPLAGESFKEPRAVVRRITIFHCCNAIGNIALSEDDYELRTVNMPCSGMSRDVVLLKAFEAGADAVVVLVCPEGTCHYLEGNLRARKRVARVKNILNEIGLDGRRLNIFNVSPEDQSVVERIIGQTVSNLASLGPSPAR